MRGPRDAVEIPDGISDVLADSVKEVVFKVLLELQFHHPSSVLQSNLVEGPF